MKKIARVFASSTLKVTLFTAALVAALMGIIGSPEGLKKPLADSKIYDTLVEGVLNHMGEEQAKDAAQPQDFNINDPRIKQAAETALDSATLQQSTETIIDGIYNWLNGDVQLPDFRVDLTAAKQNFVAAAAQQAEVQVSSLPVCTPQEAAALGTEIDPFTATCRPAGYSAVAARQEVENSLNTGDFLKDTVISADTLTSEDGKNPFAEAEAAPKAFQRAKNGSWIFLGLSVLLAAAVFFLSETYRRGAKSLGKTFLWTGLLVLVSGWLTGAILSNMLQPAGAIGKLIDNNSLQTSALAVLRAIADAFSGTMLIYGLIYGLLGGATLLALKFLWKPEVVLAAPQAKSVVTKPVAAAKPAVKSKK